MPGTRTRSLQGKPTRVLRRPVHERPYSVRPYRRTRRRRSYTKLPRLRLSFGQIAILMVIAGIILIWQINQSPSTPGAYVPQGPYSIEGKPTVSADFIDRVLKKYHSPASGKGQKLYDLGVKYNIDPVYALAFFMHESSFGTAGVATVTHSLGNIRVTPGYADYQGYRKYPSWEVGFEDWYKLMRDQYIDQWHLGNVDDIIPRYAPSSDNNDEAAYIDSIKHAVDTWRGGSTSI